MQKIALCASVLLGVLLCSSLLVVPTVPFAPVTSQEGKPGEEKEKSEAEKTQPKLRAQLDALQLQIKKQLDLGNKEKARTLRARAEELLDELERLDRARPEREEEGEEEEQEELEQVERRRLQLEVHRLEREIDTIRQQAALRLAEIGGNQEASIALALTQAIDQLGEEEALDFLNEMAKKTSRPAVRRMIRHHLVTLNQELDRQPEARRILQSLILDKD